MAKKSSSTTTQKPAVKPFFTGLKPGGDHEHWLSLGLIVLAITAACYLPTLWHDYVNWDDPTNITENPNLLEVGKGQAWSTTIADIFDIEKGSVIGNYNPLSILTFAIEKSLAGGEFSPSLTHSINLLLHLLTVYFVMQLLWGMGIGRWGVAAGGLLFGIHPMRVESVAWASERKDVLFALFFFMALVYYVKWLKLAEKGEIKLGTYLIVVLLALLSCLSKVQAVTLPLSMLALDFWFRRPLKFSLFGEKLVFWVFSLLFGLINLHTLKVQGATNDSVLNYNLLDRLCIGAYSYCTYLYKLLLPFPMSPLYSYPKSLPWTVYAAPIALAAVLAGFIWAWRKGYRIWVFGGLFFTVNVMFVLQIFAAGQGFLADRFTYVAYFGFFAVAAYYLEALSKRANAKSYVYAALGSATLVFGIWTIQQESIWKNGYTLWTHVMNQSEGKSERSMAPILNRGQYLSSQGDYAAALKEYVHAIEMDPNNPDLLITRGKTYFKLASSDQYKSQKAALLDKSIQDFSAALSKPNISLKSKGDALINRGTTYGVVGNFEQCIRDITEGLQVDPKNKDGYANRSFAYLNLQQYDKALADYHEYLLIDPDNANFWYESALIMRAYKEYAKAIYALDNAIRLNPKFGLAYLERARSKALSGDLSTAQLDYRKAQQNGAALEPIDEQWYGK